jgi:hypothetical protein
MAPDEHPPLVLRPKLDQAMLYWMLQMLRNCTAVRYALNKSRTLRLADYSRTLPNGPTISVSKATKSLASMMRLLLS